MSEYIFIKEIISNSILTKSINDSNISQNVSYINWNSPDDLHIFFENDLTTNEQIMLQTIVTNHVGGNGQFYAENYHVSEYTSGKLIKETWYEKDNGDGTYSNKAREIVYSWNVNSLTGYIENVYCTNGILWTTQPYSYYVNGTTVIEKKV